MGITITGGDFNYTMKAIDREHARSEVKNVQSVNTLKSLIKINNLTDRWKYSNKNKQQYIWRRKDKSQARRIDMILIGSDFISLVECCKIKNAVIDSPDHQSVFMKFRMVHQKREGGTGK